jgi:peptidoglycan/LPS O-acetylase OafA/YrhL
MPLALVLALAVVLQYTVQLTLVALVAAYLVAYAIVQQARVSGFLTWRPLVYLGQRSYGAYLLHFLALRIGYLIFGIETTAGALLSAGFCILVTVPAAALMYRAIERPAIAAGQWLLRLGPQPLRGPGRGPAHGVFGPQSAI